jgi:hypothetical protein
MVHYRFKLKTLVPSLWATIALVHEIISKFDVTLREKAEDESIKAFRLCGEEVTGDWINYPHYIYFYRLNAKEIAATVVAPTTATPYLELLRLIRNATCHINSLSKIAEISGHMPICLHTWVRSLWMLCNCK